MDRRSAILSLAGTLAVASRGADAFGFWAGAAPALRELRVPVPGGQVYVQVHGELGAGRTPIVMVHGGPGGALWQFQPAIAMAAQRPVILYDQLDSGRSDAPGKPENWTVDRFASEIEAIRASLSLASIHLLGHSWGGQVATHYAARRPKGLKSVILQGTPPSARRAEASVQALLAELPDGGRAAINTAEESGKLDDPAYGRAMQAFYRKHIGRTDLNAIAGAYMQSLPEDRGQALANALNGPTATRFTGSLRGFDDEPLLRRITAPTLLLCGEFDLMSPAATREVLPLLKHGAFAEIAGAGHMIQFDQPDAWRAAIAGFVRKHDA